MLLNEKTNETTCYRYYYYINVTVRDSISSAHLYSTSVSVDNTCMFIIDRMYLLRKSMLELSLLAKVYLFIN